MIQDFLLVEWISLTRFFLDEVKISEVVYRHTPGLFPPGGGGGIWDLCDFEVLNYPWGRISRVLILGSSRKLVSCLMIGIREIAK